MKKIILILMLIPNIVKANVVYTEYEEYLKETSELIEENDLIKREEIILYNTYKEEFEEKYAKINELDESYNINLNDYYLEEKNNIEQTEYAIKEETKCFNKFNNITDIKVESFSSQLHLSEINYTTKDDTKMRLNVDNYIGDSQNILFDNNLYSESIIVSKHSTITFRLQKTTDLDNLILKLYFPKQGKKIIDFKITLDYSNNIYGTFELNDEDTEINITFDKLYEEFLINNNFQTENACISYYNELIPYYRHTKINKIPLNNYISLNDKNLFLLDDFKIKYNYYKREKLEIKDNITLENKKLDITKHLISTLPLDKLTITDNIDYSKSGTYSLKIYYQQQLLLEHPIIYKKTNLIKEDNPKIDTVNNNQKEEKSNIKKYNKAIKKTTTKKTIEKNKLIKTSKITTNKIIKKNIVEKSNNNINTKNNKKTLIMIITMLILLLTIFEIILLYVKHKYF